jgi:hypothetical protein
VLQARRFCFVETITLIPAFRKSFIPQARKTSLPKTYSEDIQAFSLKLMLFAIAAVCSYMLRWLDVGAGV